MTLGPWFQQNKCGGLNKYKIHQLLHLSQKCPTPSKEDDATAITSSATLLTSPSLDQISESVDPLEEEADMVDYESTPVHEGMDINMVYYTC